MKAGLESVSSCCGLSSCTATAPGSFSTSAALSPGMRSAMPPYTVLIRWPGTAPGTLLASSARKALSISSMCAPYFLASALLASRARPVTEGLVPGRPGRPPP